MAPGHPQGGGARGSHSNILRDTRSCVKVKEKTLLTDKSEQENTSLSGAGKKQTLVWRNIHVAMTKGGSLYNVSTTKVFISYKVA